MHRTHLKVLPQVDPSFRTGGNPWGMHRVLDNTGGLPQSAWRLDPSLPPYENEIVVSLESLQLDSASFLQLMGQGGNIDRLIERISRIIQDRGKMHNPDTDSGGVFLGTVSALGPKHPLKAQLNIGDRIVSLVSLSLTPLSVDAFISVGSEKCRVMVKGHGILFETGMAQKMPEDLSEGVVLAALDVCGAAAQLKRLAHPGDKVLIIGLGKAGRSAACQALLEGMEVLGIDSRTEAVDWCKQYLKGRYRVLHAGDSEGVYRWIHEETRGALVDLVLHATPVEKTEMSALLSCREGGSVIYFGMRTSFQRVVLGAEGIGKDVTLLMGSGFVPGHSDLMLNLLRKNQALREWFEKEYS